MIPLVLCLLSGAIAALGGALVCSGGAALFAPVLPPACVVALLAAVAACFPRAIAFPLSLLGGLAAVWLGFSFFRFIPAASKAIPLASVYRDGAGAFRISLNPAGVSGGQPGLSGIASPPAVETGPDLTFSAVLLSFDRRLPLVGGERRCFITRINWGGEPIFKDPRLRNPLLSAYYAHFTARGRQSRWFSVSTLWADLPARALFRGMGRTLVFGGESLGFSPGWNGAL
jgi:hypothetical protein